MSTELLDKLDQLRREPATVGGSRRTDAPRPGGTPAGTRPVSARMAVVAVASAGLATALLISAQLAFQWNRTPAAPAAAQPGAAALAPKKASGEGLVASGYVVARRQATVAAQVTGQVARVLVDEGDHVRRGQVLAHLDADAASAGVAEAGAQVRSAEFDADRYRTQLRDARVTQGRYLALAARGFARGTDVQQSTTSVKTIEAQIATARADAQAAQARLVAARTNLDRHVVRAPFDGIVTAVNAQPGEMISPISAGGGFTRTGICTLVDMTSLQIEVDVAETYIARAREGLPATVTLEAHPEHPYAGRVAAIVPVADRSRATFRVRVRIDQLDGQLLPEMAATIRFHGESR